MNTIAVRRFYSSARFSIITRTYYASGNFIQDRLMIGLQMECSTLDYRV